MENNLEIFGYGEPTWTPLFGIAIGKKAKARVAVRQENRQAKKELKREAKASRIYARKAKADARVTLANQGISTQSGVGSVLSQGAAVATNLASSLAPIFGGGAGQVFTDDGSTTTEQPTFGGINTVPPVSNTSQFDQGTKDTYNPNQLPVQVVDLSKDKMKNMYLLIGGALVVLVIVVMLLKKKKK